MNWSKTIFAAALVALMALAYLPQTPIAATSTGVTVFTTTTTVNNTIYFEVNLTYLKNTFGWVGTTADIYVSNNGYGTIQPGVSDLKLVSGIYIADADYILGTLFINKTVVDKLLNGTNGYLYIKITDGANVAVSNRFYIMTDIGAVFSANTYNLSKTGYKDSSISTENKLNLTVDITSILSALDLNLSKQNISITLYSNLESLTLYKRTHSGNTTSETSDVLNLQSTSVSAKVVKVNGTLKDFALKGSNAVLTVQGIPVAFEKFHFSIEAWNKTISEDNAIEIINNYYDPTQTPHTVSIENVTINIGSINKTISIFPSVELVGFTELAGNTTQINPGDNMTIKLYNFYNTTDTINVCLFIYGDGKLVGISTNATVNATYGNATVTVTLPEAQYGGRYFFVAAKQGAGLRGLPATNGTVASGPATFRVMPYIDVAFVYNNGTFSDFNAQTYTAPGDYVLVKGHGFIQENLTVSTVYGGSYDVDLSFIADISGDSKIHVYDNGTFFSLFQIPGTADPAHSPLKIAAHGGTATNVGYSVISFEYKVDGSVYKVFVNPYPHFVAGSGWTPDRAIVEQMPVNPAYPAATPWINQLWTSGGESNFTVEVIGVPFTSGSISLTTDNTTYFAVAPATFTNGYFKGLVDVPVVPYGNYYAAANDTTTHYVGYHKEVFVRQTARAIDPVELVLHSRVVYTLQVFLGEAINITVLGYGWPGSATVSYTIAKDGTLASYTQTFTTLANGTFNITANISKFLETNGEGNYTLTIAYNTTVMEVIHIYYSVTPNVKVEIKTATLKLTYPGDTVDVYAIVYLGNSLLDNDTVKPYSISVKVTVYYYNGSHLEKLIDNENMTYMHEPGIWHYRFAIPYFVKGDDLLVKVTATVQPKFFMIPKSDIAFASLTVASSLTDLLNSTINEIKNNAKDIKDLINSTFNKLDLELTSINGKLVLMSETLNETYADVQYLISLAHAINANLTLVYMNTEAISGQITNATGEINNNIGSLYLALVAYGNQILSNESLILVRLNTTLDMLGTLITKVDNNTVTIISKLGTVETNISTLLNKLNATLVGVVEDEAYRIVGVIHTSEGNLTATMNALYNLTKNNINVAKSAVLASIANLNANASMYATEILNDLGLIKNNMTKLDTIISGIDNAKTNILNELRDKATTIGDKIENSRDEIKNKLDRMNSTINDHIDSSQNTIINAISSANTSITNIVKDSTSKITKSIDDAAKSLGQKLDSTSSTLGKKIDESNSSVKGRVTTMTSLSTVVLLAAIVGMGFIFRGSRPS